MPSKGELVVYEGGPTDIAVARPPDVVLEEAHKAAKALMDVMGAKKKKVMMNGEQYLEFEDWQTVGRFYGVTVKVVSTEFIDYGGAKGFLAKAVVLRQDGAEISAAEAMCLNDEEKWSTRAKYEWQGPPNARQRVKVADEPVPLFQLRSMAQTRACAKALRNVLAWVVVLAGYRPTPAEEMEGVEGVQEERQAAKATPKPATSAPPPSDTPGADAFAKDMAQEKELEMRDELEANCQIIGSAKNMDVSAVLASLTAYGKFVGYTKISDVPYAKKKADGSEWKYLETILGKSKKVMEGLDG